MQRQVQPELLDELSPADPRALASRADLRRLNTWMANSRLAADALISAFGKKAPSRIVELGAGDGNFLLSLGRRLGARWPRRSVVMVDRQNVVEPQTLTAFGRLGWRPQVVVTDVFDWFRQSSQYDDDALVANVSVRAGFTGRELSRLWPRDENWELHETAAGLFSHLFVARRRIGIRDPKSETPHLLKSPETQATGKTAMAETRSFSTSIFAIPSAFGFRNSDFLR
jgi:hypothetical protein